MASRKSRFRKADALRHLSLADDRLGSIIRSVGSYDIKIRSDPFQSLVEAIIYQQLAGSAADAIYGRFLKSYGSRFPRPDQILATKDAKFRNVGLSARKIEYLKRLGAASVRGSLETRSVAINA